MVFLIAFVYIFFFFVDSVLCGRALSVACWSIVSVTFWLRRFCTLGFFSGMFGGMAVLY